MIEDENLNTLRPSDNRIKTILDDLRKDNNWRAVSAETIITNANANKAVYKFMADETIGCAPSNITYHIAANMDGFGLDINDTHLTDWQLRFCDSDRSIAPILASIRPVQRPVHQTLTSG